MPANINFPELTDEETFLESREAGNIFFGQFNVSNATTTTYGVVKRGASVDGIESGLVDPFSLTLYRVQVLREDGSYEYQELCDKTEVENALNSMRLKLNAVIASLKNSGQLA